MSDNEKPAFRSLMQDVFAAMRDRRHMGETFAALLPMAFAYVSILAGLACGIETAPIVVKIVFVVPTFALAGACGREYIRRRSAERRLARAERRESQWKAAADAAAKVVPDVVDRSLDEWFAAHGIGDDVEKSREAMENLDRFANSMFPKAKR